MGGRGCIDAGIMNPSALRSGWAVVQFQPPHNGQCTPPILGRLNVPSPLRSCKRPFCARYGLVMLASFWLDGADIGNLATAIHRFEGHAKAYAGLHPFHPSCIELSLFKGCPVANIFIAFKVDCNGDEVSFKIVARLDCDDDYFFVVLAAAHLHGVILSALWRGRSVCDG